MENQPICINLNTTKQTEQMKEKLRYLSDKYSISKDNKGTNEWNKNKLDNELFYKSSKSSIELNLPKIELFSETICENTNDNNCNQKKQPQLIDLCYEDKLRISHLIEEITKCKERNIEDTKTITDLQSEKLKLTIDITKLEKEITRLLSESEEKGNKIKELNKKLNAVIQDYKMQLTELKLKMDVSEKQLNDKLSEQQNKNKELAIAINKLNINNRDLNNKYENKKNKLNRALTLIKNMIRKPNYEDAIVTKEKYCQVPSMTNTRSNINMKSTAEKERPTNTIQNTSDQQILSELFFKVTSNNCFEETDPFMFLMQDSNKYNT